MSWATEWGQRMSDRHIKEVEDGKHDDECEWAVNFRLCHCHKRARIKRGLIEPPDEELYFPPPDCTACDKELIHDGDGWVCYDCALSWDSYGNSAQFTDDYGNLSHCKKHSMRACVMCERETRSPS